MRPGAEYFLTPAGASQRRYEALRAYFVGDMPAAEVADRFGYSTASVHQMATLLRGPDSPTSKYPSPGGTAAPCDSGSRHDDHQPLGNLNSIT